MRGREYRTIAEKKAERIMTMHPDGMVVVQKNPSTVHSFETEETRADGTVIYDDRTRKSPRSPDSS